MGKRKSIDLLNVADSEKMKLVWEIRRQMQQESFEGETRTFFAYRAY